MEMKLYDDHQSFSAEFLGNLSYQAVFTPRRRQHLNLHTDYVDACQRLFNAIEPDSYLQPHRHGHAQGPETMIAVRGLMALVIFDGGGKITEVHRFGAGTHAADPSVAVGIETPPGIWHTVVSLESGSVLLELKAGPFDPHFPKFAASWAPAEGTADGKNTLNT